MVTNVFDETNAISTSETSFARQQNSTAANTTLTVNQDQTRLTKPAMVNPYRPPRKSTNATSIVPVPKLPEDVISPNEVTAEEWHTLGIQYDPPNTNTDLFDNIDPTVLAELEEEEQENPAMVSYEQDKNGAPSAAMLNIQRSLALLTDAERRTLHWGPKLPILAAFSLYYRQCRVAI